MSWDSRIRRRLKLRDLDTLLAVARWGSMAQAAVQLSVSQPAVSKAIADIEHTLGVRLFDRTAQGVEPTLFGRAMLKWAAAVFDDVRQGVNEIAFLADPTIGEVRVGSTEPVVAGMLPAVVGLLNRRHPRIVCQIKQIGAGAEQIRELRERNVDLLLGRVMAAPKEDDLATEILFDEPLFVVASERNPLVRRRKIELADLIDEPWTLPHPDTVVGSFVRQIFQAHGLEIPPANVICNSIQMHSALLADGRHLALFPRSVLHFSGRRMSIKVLPVRLPSIPTPIGIVTLKNRTISPVAQVFIECVREVARPLATKN